MALLIGISGVVTSIAQDSQPNSQPQNFPILVGPQTNQSQSGNTNSVVVPFDQVTGQSGELDAKLDEPVDASDNINNLITNLVLESIPHTYEDDKKWGQQEERWDGVRVWRDGWEIKTKRRKKLVNHGKWQKYSATLINPEDEFGIEVNQIRQTEDGKMAFEINFVAHLAIQARHSNWVKGVQLYSISGEGSAKVRLALDCEMKINLDFGEFPPDVIFIPEVVAADLHVDEFRLDRVSKLGGEFSQQVGKAARKIMDEKIEEREEKLVKKINKQIAKKQDELRLSLAEALESEWTEKALPALPANVVEAIKQIK